MKIPFPVYPPSVIQKMPEAQQAFEDCFEEFGPSIPTMNGNAQILSVEWFKRRYWDYLTKFQNVPLYRPALLKTYFDCIDNSDLNAFVGSYRDFGLVALFSGAVKNFGIYFDLILSHPMLFRDIGEPEKQNLWFDNLSAWDWKLSLAVALGSFHTKKGKEPEHARGARQDFAGHLQMFALDFLFFHEIGHWCNGHDIFVSKHQSNNFVNELDAGNLPAIPNQLLELNADSFAVTLMTNEWLQMMDFGPSPVFRSPLEALRTWAIAMTFIFVLFGQERKIRVVKPAGIHPHPALLDPYPHPAIRLENMRQTAMGIARLVSDKAVSVMAQALEEGITIATEVCGKLKMPSSLWYADSETINRTFQALMMEWGLLYNSEVTACTRLDMSKRK